MGRPGVVVSIWGTWPARISSASHLIWLRRLMDEAFHRAGVQAQTQYEVPAGFAAIADLVRNGLGTSFMPASEARRFGDLRTVALRDPAVWQVYLAAPPAQRMTPAAARLAETLLAAAASAAG